MPAIPGYTNLFHLGGGTFGEVYRAVDADQKIVAIKILKETSADSFRRFKRECNLLHHERENRFVVDIYLASLDTIPPYLVMEHCEFGSLRPWVTSRQSWQNVALALSHALQGLEGIHRGGGFHRDIKPDNLLRARSKDDPSRWIVKVGDFGLAGGVLPTSSTATFSPHGSPAYMAPELLRGGDPSAASDIYSLGITGSELLTGRRDPKALQATQCPGVLKWLLTAMVQENPGQRPSTSVIAAMLYTLFSPPDKSADESAQSKPAQPATQQQAHPVGAQRPAQPPVRVPQQAARPLGPQPAAYFPGPGPQQAARPQGVAQPNVEQRRRQVANSGAGAGLGLFGLGVLGLLALLAHGQNKDWDADVGRYRGPDGKFRR